MLSTFKAAQCCAVVFAMIAAGGCGAVPQRLPPPPSENSQATQPPTRIDEINKALSAASQQSAGTSKDYRLGPDDLLQITIYNIPEQEARVTPRSTTLRVSQDGMIVVPLLGQMEVRGKTTGDLERELNQRYAKFIRNPQVGVLVMEFRQRVSVMGAVQKPGVFDLTGPRSVVDALALAGGVTERAGNQVHVYRHDANGGRQSIVMDLTMLANGGTNLSTDKLNFSLQAGDVVNVPQAGMFFVDGAVGKPGSYPLGRDYTLTQALAIAGGVDPELANYSEVTINRRQSVEKVKIIPVDLNEVSAGRAADPQLQPDDVVLVPMSSFKYFVKRFVGTIFSGVSAGSFVGR
ncbi:MAG: polysaccharide biosynthesis/export family protein [Candidatus Binatia bacterium]